MGAAVGGPDSDGGVSGCVGGRVSVWFLVEGRGRRGRTAGGYHVAFWGEAHGGDAEAVAFEDVGLAVGQVAGFFGGRGEVYHGG